MPEALLTYEYDTIETELLGRYRQTQFELSERYDLKNLNVYYHFHNDNYFSTEKDSQIMISWVNKVGGKMRLMVDNNVDLVIVDSQYLLKICQSFI